MLMSEVLCHAQLSMTEACMPGTHMKGLVRNAEGIVFLLSLIAYL